MDAIRCNWKMKSVRFGNYEIIGDQKNSNWSRMVGVYADSSGLESEW